MPFRTADFESAAYTIRLLRLCHSGFGRLIPLVHSRSCYVARAIQASGVRAGPRWLIAGVVILFVYGVIGYIVLGYSAGESIHNTILVLTTVGYTPVDPSTSEKLFTASVAALGVALFLAALAVFAAAIAEGRIGETSRRRRMDRRISSLSNHFIVCAYGRVGRTIARELEAEGTPFAVVDRLEELEESMRADGVLYLIADPTQESALRQAGIEQARALITAVDSDADNVYITLTARSLNPNVFIVARASEAAAADRLYRAGADRVVSPYVSSGRHMALLAMQPGVLDYLDLAGERMRLEELVVDRTSPMVGSSLAKAAGASTPLAVRRADGEVLSAPSPDVLLAEGDLILLLGEPGKLREAGRPKRRTRARSTR